MGQSKSLNDEKTKCIQEFYSYMSISDPNDFHIGGLITLANNIADIRGLKLSYSTYRNHLMDNKKSSTLLIPSTEKFLHPDTFFFIAYAQVKSKFKIFQVLINHITMSIYTVQLWCSNGSTDKIKEAAKDHTPNNYRVLGIMSNSIHFLETFQCNHSHRMWPKNKPCDVW
jgi:predicted metalloendopeptidase